MLCAWARCQQRVWTFLRRLATSSSFISCSRQHAPARCVNTLCVSKGFMSYAASQGGAAAKNEHIMACLEHDWSDSAMIPASAQHMCAQDALGWFSNFGSPCSAAVNSWADPRADCVVSAECLSQMTLPAGSRTQHTWQFCLNCVGKRCPGRVSSSNTDCPSSCVAASVVHVTSAFTVGVVARERCVVGLGHDPGSCATFFSTRGARLTLGCSLPVIS